MWKEIFENGRENTKYQENIFENIVGEKNAIDTHYIFNKAIRNTIKELGGYIWA